MKFQKPPLDIPGLLQKWQSRGLTIPDPAKAAHYLRFIGYYRLSAYALPFQQAPVPTTGQSVTGPDKPFKPGTTFDDLLNLYVFDRELRLVVMDAVERMEVAIRSCIVNEMCLRQGSHWFMDQAHFAGGFRHDKLMEKIEQELDISSTGTRPQSVHHERFINHYYKKYTDPYLPPAWMIAETLPLGTWSYIYAHLNQAERKIIATHFQVDAHILSNWLHSLTYLRNLCAHHARLWNRQFVIKPVIARKHAGFLKSNDRFYAMAVILHDLLRIIAPGTTWHQRLAALLQATPVADCRSMGFPPGWEKETFWL
jgi:abortive infection bacteriophage resistance protein